jgi:hypothetical protein
MNETNHIPIRKARLTRALELLCLLALVWLGLAAKAAAQGIESESLAGESAAEAADNKTPGGQPYNLQLGAVSLRVDATASVSYNDNINISRTDRENDFIITPLVDIHGLWQATEVNALTFDLGIGYQAYVTHSNFDSLIISPDSQTQFNIYIGDFKINLHDQLYFQDNPIQVGDLSSTSQFPLLINTAGIKVDWDLGDLILSLGYDHSDSFVFSSAFDYLNDHVDALTPQLTYKITKTIQVGLTSSLSDQTYDKNVENNSTGVQGGPFISAEITNDLSVEAQGGYDYRSYDTGGTNGDTENIDSYYWSVGVNHRLNDQFYENLAVGREYISGLTSNFTRRIYANYQLTWQATSSINISPDLWWENLNDSDSIVRQQANRYGVGLNVEYLIAEHSSLIFSYQYALKIASPSDLNYTQNVATVGYRYQF